jgi:hypothetical protein
MSVWGSILGTTKNIGNLTGIDKITSMLPSNPLTSVGDNIANARTGYVNQPTSAEGTAEQKKQGQQTQNAQASSIGNLPTINQAKNETPQVEQNANEVKDVQSTSDALKGDSAASETGEATELSSLLKMAPEAAMLA